MKRNYMVDLIAEFLWENMQEYGFKKYAKEDAEKLLKILEDQNMFYCPVEDLGEFKLRTPKGWDVDEGDN